MCYLFLAPYAILFTMFYVLPVVNSIYYSFTYYNILEPPRFIGLQNYISLILQDDIFLIGVKNTLMIALITGPLGYILSFLFAWLINELPVWIPDGIWLKKIPRIIPNIDLYKWEWRKLVLVRLGFMITSIVFQLSPRDALKYNSTANPAIAVIKNKTKDSFK